jgi:hypothetical protein
MLSGWLVVACGVLVAACSVRPPPSVPAATSALPPVTPPTVTHIELRAAPDDFDPAEIRWIGNETGSTLRGYAWDVWAGTLDGRLEVIGSMGIDGGAYADDERFYFRRWLNPDGDMTPFLEIQSEVLEGSGRFFTVETGYVVAGDTVYTNRLTEQRDGGVWAVPLDDSEPWEVIPPRGRVRSALAVTPDGVLVASGSCGPNGDTGPIEIARDGVAIDNRVSGDPIGFDADGRLLVWESCTRGRIIRLEPPGAQTVAEGVNMARTTPDGQYLVSFGQREDFTAQELRVTNLEDGASWAVGVDGSWSLTNLGGNGHAVLEGYAPGAGRLQPLVVSLDERWLGLLPPLEFDREN